WTWAQANPRARRTSRRGTSAAGPSDGGACHEACVHRQHLLGRLPEVEALAEVDPERLHLLELEVALDADRDHAAVELVGELDEGGDQRVPRGRGVEPLAE